MTRLLTALFLCIILAAAKSALGEAMQYAPQVRKPAIFTFKPVLETGAERIELGMLADCVGIAVICEEAYGVDLGPAPEPGKTATLTRERLLALLSREWDEAAVEVNAPPGGVRIISLSEELDGDSVTAGLQAFFDAELGEASRFRVEVAKVHFSGRPRLRPGEHKLEFPELTQLASRNEDWLVKHAQGNQKIVVRVGERQLAAQTSLLLKKQLPVAARNLERGHFLNEKDFEIGWVDLGHGANSGFAVTARDASGKRLRRNLALGMPVVLADLETPLAIHRGQMVRLVMNGDGLSISGHVKALANGTYGQTIEALYPTTKKRLRVKVIDSSTVEYLE